MKKIYFFYKIKKTKNKNKFKKTKCESGNFDQFLQNKKIEFLVAKIWYDYEINFKQNYCLWDDVTTKSSNKNPIIKNF